MNESKLLRKFKDKKIANGIMSKIRDLEVSDHLFEFFQAQPNCGLHPLKGARRGEISIYAVNKTCPIRIVFVGEDGEDITDDMYNKEKWKTITAIKIIEIGDYHK